MPDDTYSAKQVATRIGTDAKTLRKFLRSTASPYQAVGQGKRYEFPIRDLKTIKKAFDKWHAKGAARRTITTPAATPAQKIRVTVNQGPVMTMDADDNPTEADLMEIERELEAHFPDEDFDLEMD